MEELRLSRLRIMEAGDAARRRIERNLHDGAQQQLVALALELRMLKARAARTRQIDELSERLATRAGRAARARARHPSRDPHRPRARPGDQLARRARRRCRSTSRSSCRSERLPAPVEAAAYFLVAEALTNVARYAEASSARVEVRLDGDALVVRVADDGVGGVDPSAGGGLRGLDDRVAAVGGTLAIDSPVGGGTRLRGDGCRYEAARLLLLCSCSPAAAGPRSCASRPSTSPARRLGRPARARRCPDGAVRIAVVTHGPASSKFWAIIRNGVDSAARRLDVLVDYQSPDVYSLERMSALIDQAVATKPDGLVVSIPEPGLAPAIRRAVAGGHPGRLDQLRQRRLPVARRARPRRPGRGPRGAGGRAPAGRRGRAARAVHQPAGRQHRASTPAAAGWRRRCARSAALARAADRRRRPAHAAAGSRAPWPPTGADGVLATNSLGGLAAAEGARRAGVKIGTFDLGPDVLKAVEAGEIGFAVDQQAYLQGYLPIEMLALRARYGIFPSAGRRRRHGPALRHPRRRRAGARAERALDSLGGRLAGAGSRPGAFGPRRTSIAREPAGDAARPSGAIAHARAPLAAVERRARPGRSAVIANSAAIMHRVYS